VRTDRRCTARTQKGRRCQMRVVHGERLCRAHHPDHARQWKAECRKRTQNYWAKWRAAKALAAKAGDAEFHQPNRDLIHGC
jgi:hypothetical protein